MLTRPLKEPLGRLWQPLSYDDDTKAFVESCTTTWATWILDTITQLLRFFGMSLTDANGFLGRGQMHVLSRAQGEELLAPGLEARRVALAAAQTSGSASAADRALRLLDVGAGDGEVTAKLAHLFQEVHATEVSQQMAKRLRAKGYRVSTEPFLTPEAYPETGSYDVVSLLNLLDRCDYPLEQLRGAARLMRPVTGRLLIALVLPYAEFVEEGARRRPVKEPLNMRGARCGDGVPFEDSLEAFLTRACLPLGLAVERIARVPYLCRGDSHKAYYTLSDAILVLRHATAEEMAAASFPALTSSSSSSGAMAMVSDGLALSAPPATTIRVVR